MAEKTIPALDNLAEYPSWIEVAKTYAKCQRILAARLADLDLSVAQHEILLAIGRDAGLSQNELARRLLVVKSNVTGMLQRLESRGLIRRKADKQDRRGRHVYLTAKGRRLLEKSVRRHAGVVRLMADGLTRRQLDDLGRIMRRVGRSLDRALLV